MQTEWVKMQRANGDEEKLPDVFEEDDYITTPLSWMRWAKFGAAACCGIGLVFGVIALTAPSSNAQDIVEDVVEHDTPPLTKYEVIQEDIDSINNKRIEELTYQEDLRVLRKQAEDALRTKIASYNEDINASKDRVIGLDSEVAKLKKQQVTISTIVND